MTIHYGRLRETLLFLVTIISSRTCSRLNDDGDDYDCVVIRICTHTKPGYYSS